MGSRSTWHVQRVDRNGAYEQIASRPAFKRDHHAHIPVPELRKKNKRRCH
jgi:hypothetical protein